MTCYIVERSACLWNGIFLIISETTIERNVIAPIRTRTGRCPSIWYRRSVSVFISVMNDGWVYCVH